MDPQKIKAVINWPRPIISNEERSFLSLAGSLAHISTERRPIIKELHELIEQRLQLKVARKCLSAQFRVRSVYLDRDKAAQRRDQLLQKILCEVQQDQSRGLVFEIRALCVWALNCVCQMWMV